ncbi:hypothetical protein Dvar_65460 [Desulfosarcina variabilis str. Montpellier]|uniref:hypothetical protein n=1 Tax=Desulfosarcina variabilis TaxID=2300 RepID=UPI003AFB0531
MDRLGPYGVSKKVITYEIIGFALIILFIWFDEWIDISHLLFDEMPTPFNWKEASFESLLVAALGAMIINYTRKIFQHMKHLEGILPVCSSCKKIRDENGNWQALESYIHDKSAARFSHGICPECKKRLYPEFFSDKE